MLALTILAGILVYFYVPSKTFVRIQTSRTVVDVIKLFFGGNLENLDFPQSWNSKIGHFKSNKQF